MSAALGLYRLQQVDSQMDQAQLRLKAIRQTLENDVELRAAHERLAAAEGKFKNAERTLKQCEQDVEKQRIKLQQTEASLYGGLVHNPKELQDLQKDVASLKRHLETLEERQLESMDVAETAEKEWQQASADVDAIKSNRGVQFRHLTTESESINKDLEKLTSERGAVMQDLGTQSVGIYDQLRKQRRGIAVATISDGSCAACGTMLTQALQQNARSANQLCYCPTCGRILYAN
jgi:predicted  nucleic acid-binding Zn-ribbon protein